LVDADTLITKTIQDISKDSSLYKNSTSRYLGDFHMLKGELYLEAKNLNLAKLEYERANSLLQTYSDTSFNSDILFDKSRSIANTAITIPITSKVDYEDKQEKFTLALSILNKVDTTITKNKGRYLGFKSYIQMYSVLGAINRYHYLEQENLRSEEFKENSIISLDSIIQDIDRVIIDELMMYDTRLYFLHKMTFIRYLIAVNKNNTALELLKNEFLTQKNTIKLAFERIYKSRYVASAFEDIYWKLNFQGHYQLEKPMRKFIQKNKSKSEEWEGYLAKKNKTLENQIKEKEIDLKRVNKDLNSSIIKLETQGATRFFLVSFLIASLCFAIYYFIQSNRNKKQKKELDVIQKNSTSVRTLANSELKLKSFFPKLVENSYSAAKEIIDFDALLIGVKHPYRDELIIYAKEQRKLEDVTPQKSITINLNDKEHLAVKAFTEGELFLKNNSNNDDKPRPKAGGYSNSIIYKKIGEDMLISIQSEKENAFRKKDLQLLETIGNNIYLAYQSVKKVEELDNNKNEITHRVKNHLLSLSLSIDEKLEDEKLMSNSSAKSVIVNFYSRISALMLIHQMLHDNQKEFISGADYINELTELLFSKAFDYEDHQIDKKINLENMKNQHFETLREIGVIIVELSLNIFEHAYKGKNITKHWIGFIARLNEDKHLEIIIEDEGKGGLTQEMLENSDKEFGLTDIVRRVENNHGRILSLPRNYDLQGTKLVVTIPVIR